MKIFFCKTLGNTYTHELFTIRSSEKMNCRKDDWYSWFGHYFDTLKKWKDSVQKRYGRMIVWVRSESLTLTDKQKSDKIHWLIEYRMHSRIAYGNIDTSIELNVITFTLINAEKQL